MSINNVANLNLYIIVLTRIHRGVGNWILVPHKLYTLHCIIPNPVLYFEKHTYSYLPLNY